MTRNDGGTPPGDLTRAAQITETQNAIDPNDYWVRSSTQPDNYQFTGDNTGDKQVAAAAQTKTDAPGTYTVTDKDSLWTIASKLVKDSDCKDKSDKFKLDVVKGLVEKNKDVKGLEANPDVIRGGQVLKIDTVEELAKLGHGKTLNTHYKPPSERQKNGDGTAKDPNDPNCPPEHHKHHGGRPAGYEDQQGYDQPSPGGQRPMDLGPVKDILGMFGAIAGGAFLGDRSGGRRWNQGPRGYYDGGYGYGQGYYDGGQNYYDGGNYGYYPNQFQQYRQYTNFNNPQQFTNYQQPVDYSHYGRPTQNYVMPFNQAQQSQQFRIQQIQQQQQQQQLQLQRQQQWQVQQQQHHNFHPQVVQQQQHHNFNPQVVQQQQQLQRQQQIQQWQQQHRHA